MFAAGEVVSNHDELMSNFFAQPDALAYGKVCFILVDVFVIPWLNQLLKYSG